MPYGTIPSSRLSSGFAVAAVMAVMEFSERLVRMKKSHVRYVAGRESARNAIPILHLSMFGM